MNRDEIGMKAKIDVTRLQPITIGDCMKAMMVAINLNGGLYKADEVETRTFENYAYEYAIHIHDLMSVTHSSHDIKGRCDRHCHLVTYKRQDGKSLLL